MQGANGDGGDAISAQLNTPTGVSVDISGNVYIAQFPNNKIRMVNSAGTITTIAGTGVLGNSGDGGAATSAQLYNPIAVSVDIYGNVYIADYGNHKIRMVSSTGIITTIAGTGTVGNSGDGGAATSAQLYYPTGVSVDISGNVYIADQYNHKIRKVTSAGIITTLAGTGTAGYNGDGNAATSAQLNYPMAVSVDVSGNVYIAEGGNNKIRMVTSSGNITTIAGTGTEGSSGDGGAATSAQLNGPAGVSVDISGNVYIADGNNNKIRKVTSAGIITTLAGTGTAGYNGDGNAATSTQLNLPFGVSVDVSGNVYIADTWNHEIRMVVEPQSPTYLPTPVPIPLPTPLPTTQSMSLSSSPTLEPSVEPSIWQPKQEVGWCHIMYL